MTSKLNPPNDIYQSALLVLWSNSNKICKLASGNQHPLPGADFSHLIKDLASKFFPGKSIGSIGAIVQLCWHIHFGTKDTDFP